jgi:hypothetical protein
MRSQRCFTQRLQQQLTAARDLFGGVLDAATEMAIIATDPEGVITVFSRGQASGPTCTPRGTG